MSSAADCAYCFDVLLAACAPRSSAGTPPPLPRPRDADNKHWQQHFPLFVTWNKLRRADDVKSGYTLRGCIGCFAPLELESGLQDYAIKSALEDSRFEPVTMAEIPQLQCAVSLLTNFTPAEHVYDWIIGTHGIRIEFMVGTRRYSATYLPEVAADQGWTHEKTLTSLVAKSGYNKTVTRELLASIKTTRYESSKSYLSYADYVAMRAKPAPAPAAVASASAAVEEDPEPESVVASTVARKQITAKA